MGPQNCIPASLQIAQRFPEHQLGFGATTNVEKQTRFHLKALRFESPGAELPGKLHHTRQMGSHSIIVGELVACENAHGFSEQFSTRLADKRRYPCCGIAILARLPGFVEIDAAEAHHGPVCNLDAAEPVRLAHRNAPTKIPEGCPHPALGIRRVRQTAQSACLRFG